MGKLMYNSLFLATFVLTIFFFLFKTWNIIFCTLQLSALLTRICAWTMVVFMVLQIYPIYLTLTATHGFHDFVPYFKIGWFVIVPSLTFQSLSDRTLKRLILRVVVRYPQGGENRQCFRVFQSWTSGQCPSDFC